MLAYAGLHNCWELQIATKIAAKRRKSQVCGSGLRECPRQGCPTEPRFFVVKDSSQGPPTAANCQPPTSTNRTALRLWCVLVGIWAFWASISLDSRTPRARAVLKGTKKRVRNANRNERSQGHSLLHGHGTLSTSSVGGWRLVVGGAAASPVLPCATPCTTSCASAIHCRWLHMALYSWTDPE